LWNSAPCAAGERGVVPGIVRARNAVGCISRWNTQQTTHTARQTRVIVALLLLIIATLLAGPVGFVVMALVLLTWALVTGTLHLVIELILLPFRIVGALVRGR
jgi:hypothetical protein